MPVFLRWLLIEIIAVRILRRLRRRAYADHVYRMQSPDNGRVSRIYAPEGNYGYRRRRRLSGCSGCLVFVAAMTLGIALLIALVHWVL